MRLVECSGLSGGWQGDGASRIPIEGGTSDWGEPGEILEAEHQKQSRRTCGSGARCVGAHGPERMEPLTCLYEGDGLNA